MRLYIFFYTTTILRLMCKTTLIQIRVICSRLWLAQSVSIHPTICCIQTGTGTWHSEHSCIEPWCDRTSDIHMCSISEVGLFSSVTVMYAIMYTESTDKLKMAGLWRRRFCIKPPPGLPKRIRDWIVHRVVISDECLQVILRSW